MTLAIVRLISEIFVWEWPQWASRAGVHFLVFALFTGVLMTISLLPLVVRGRAPRWFAASLLLVAVVLIPPIETWTFDQLDLRGGDLDLFYAAHLGQTVMVLAIMIPLVTLFPGVLVRQTHRDVDKVDQIDQQHQPSGEQDFADMQ